MIEVRHYGTAGPLVVLLHGGPGAPGGVAELGRCLAPRCRVMEPLQRLSGGEPLTVAVHVADLREVIHAAGEPVQLVGSSWGAMLALTYAARHHESVEQVVLIGCGTFDQHSRDVYRRRMEEFASPRDREELKHLQARLLNEADPEHRNALFAELGKVSLRIESHDLIAADHEILHPDERGHRETWEDVLRLQGEGVQPAEFQQIRVSVLMLHGDADPHPGRLIRDSLAAHIKDLTYREFSHCGHMPWLEREAREEFLSALTVAIGVA